MHRTVTAHALTADEPLLIRAFGTPNGIGAINRYLVTVDPRTLPLGTSAVLCDLRFQDGPPAVNGINGITIEALLAVCADRLAGFQDGPFACVENEHAMKFIMGAMEELHNRARSRLARNVLGTLVP